MRRGRGYVYGILLIAIVTICFIGFQPVLQAKMLGKPGDRSGYANKTDNELSSPPVKPMTDKETTMQKKFQKKVGSLQMPFIKNVGQMDEAVAYYAPTFGGTVFVTNEGQIVYSLPEKGEEKEKTKSVTLKETVIGGAMERITGQEPAATQVNYFKGNDKSRWQSNIHTYNMVSLEELYQGISLNLHAYGNNVEKLFVVEPGAEPKQILLSMEGAESLSIDKNGQMIAVTTLGPVVFTKPVAYQEIDGTKRYVEAAYTITKFQNHKSKVENRYGFTIGQYNPDYELIIDPLLASTFLGGGDDDKSYAIALDSSNNVYVTGSTSSSDFPTAGSPYDGSYSDQFSGDDVFVSKLDSSLSTLIASTFLGGKQWDRGYAIALDSSNNIYVTGETVSSDFPITGGAYSSCCNPYDFFIAKLDSSLSTLIASTRLGGGDIGSDVHAIALDSNNNVYVIGDTLSDNFPTSVSSYDDTYGDLQDVFVAKLNSGLSTLIASTYLGGSVTERGHAIALDSSNNVYVTGNTSSADFPTAGSPYDDSYDGGDNVFVSKLDSNLSTLIASTFLDKGFGRAIALDNSNNIYVTGSTFSSTDFPITGSPYDSSHNGFHDVFVSKLDNSLSTLIASTFLGGEFDEKGYAIALDNSNNVYVTGYTESANFPTAGNPHDDSYNGSNDVSDDVFVSKLDSSLSTLIASTFLGGSPDENGYAIALDNINNVYVTGYTESANFPTAGSPYDASHNGGIDAFVAKLDICTYSISPASNSFGPGGGTGSVSVTGISGCSWNWDAAGNESWITITSGSSGSGNGTVNYTAASNTSAGPRTGTITIAGETFTVIQAGTDPFPYIKANDSDGPITPIDNLLVTVALDPGSRSGDNADWWVAANVSGTSTIDGWYYFNLSALVFVPVGDSPFNLIVTHQGTLFNLATFPVLNNIPVSGLPPGTYTFYFAVDTNRNGVLDFGELFSDSVVVNITP